MRGDQYDYDPLRDQYAEHDTLDEGIGLIVWVFASFFFAVGFCAGWVFTRLLW